MLNSTATLNSPISAGVEIINVGQSNCIMGVQDPWSSPLSS